MSNDNGSPHEAAIESLAEELPDQDRSGGTQTPARTLALAPRPPAEREVLMPLDPERVVEGMRQYQRLLQLRNPGRQTLEVMNTTAGKRNW